MDKFLRDFLSRSGEMTQTQLKGLDFEDLSQSFNWELKF